MDLDEASLGQDCGAGGDGADDTVAVRAIFDELEEGPGVVLRYCLAGVDRSNSHKITKGVAFYDADARGVLDFSSSTHRARASSGRSGSVSATVFPSVPPSIPICRPVPASAPPISKSAASARLGRTTPWTEGNFVASC